MTSVIKKNGFFLTYVAALIGAYGLDSLTTHYALSQGLGWEMNSLVNTTNFFTIFFGPLAMMVLGVTITIVYLAEKRRRNEIHSQKLNKLLDIGKTGKDGVVFAILLDLSFVIVFAILLAVVNNTMVIFGLPSPIGVFTRLLPYFSDYPELSLLDQLMLFKIIVVLAVMPFSEVFIKRRYKFLGIGEEDDDEDDDEDGGGNHANSSLLLPHCLQ